MLLRPPICAGQVRPYGGALGGVAALSADGRAAIGPAAAAFSSYSPENGAVIDAFAGVHWNNYLSFQADYLWNRNRLTIDALRTSTTGGLPALYEQRYTSRQQTVLGSAVLYFRPRSSWVRPYLSAGTGIMGFAADRGAEGTAAVLNPPGSFRSTTAAFQSAVGIDLKIRSGWGFRYSFAETMTSNAISRQLTPPGKRILATFRNLFGIVKYF